MEKSSSLTSERVNPEVHDGHYFVHLQRYIFAKKFTAGKGMVLDAGCGNGYGTALLAEDAGQVVGVDYDTEAIDYCKQHFSRPNLRFLLADCRSLPFDTENFDTVVSLEVFEHIVEWEQFLAEVRRVLRPGGAFMMSTPNRLTVELQEHSTGQPHYVYHVNEVEPKELINRLQRFFRRVELFSMRRRGNSLYSFLRGLDVFNLRFRLPLHLRDWLGQSLEASWEPGDIRSPDDFVIGQKQLRQALNVIAVCR